MGILIIYTICYFFFFRTSFIRCCCFESIFEDILVWTTENVYHLDFVFILSICHISEFTLNTNDFSIVLSTSLGIILQLLDSVTCEATGGWDRFRRQYNIMYNNSEIDGTTPKKKTKMKRRKFWSTETIKKKFVIIQWIIKNSCCWIQIFEYILSGRSVTGDPSELVSLQYREK